MEFDFDIKNTIIEKVPTKNNEEDLDVNKLESLLGEKISCDVENIKVILKISDERIAGLTNKYLTNSFTYNHELNKEKNNYVFIVTANI